MGKSLRDVDLYKTYLKWRQGSESFGCFLRAANFVSLKHYPDFPLAEVSFERDSRVTRVEEIVSGFDVRNTLFMVEAEGVQAVRTAFLLQRDRKLKAILTFNHSLHPFGLIGDREYISALLGYGEALEKTDFEGFVFILNRERFGEYDDQQLRRSFNNQYELNEEDLPQLEMLNALGYEQLVYIYCGDIKEDLENYLGYLEEKGFRVLKQRLS